MSESTAHPSLSRRQQAVLDTIRAHVQEHGYPPSIREIGEAVGLRTGSAVVYQLDQLSAKGYLRRDPRRPRALVVVDPGTVLCEVCRGTGSVPAGAA